MVGVSRQAVTDILNNSRPNCVSKEKREAILRIASEHNYRPNHAAKALKTGKSNLIGIIMPPWHNPHIAELCMALQRALAAENYIPFFTLDNRVNPVPGNLEQLLSMQIAGLITVASSLLPDNISIPVLSYFQDNPRFDSLCMDAQESSRLTLEYLAKCGHRKIGYLGWLPDSRVKFLTEEAKQRGLEFRECWQIGAPHPLEAELFDQLLKSGDGKDLPTALVIHNDILALKIMRRIHECGYRVPEDFSVIGYDDISQSRNAIPALTTISCGSADEVAGAMVRLLMNRIRNPQAPREKAVLKTVLIKRESVLELT